MPGISGKIFIQTETCTWSNFYDTRKWSNDQIEFEKWEVNNKRQQSPIRKGKTK